MNRHIISCTHCKINTLRERTAGAVKVKAMRNEEYLISELEKRGVKIEYEKTIANNSIRYFVYKGQKIYFDHECPNGGTRFIYKKSDITALLDILDNVKCEGQDIYGRVEQCTDEPDMFELFSWGDKDSIRPLEITENVWCVIGEKVCKMCG